MRRHAAIGLALACAACTGDPDPAPCSATGESIGAIVTFATFARQVDESTAEGINLDAHDTDLGEEAGCFKQDFVSPDGRAGIDNQLGTLLPLIESLVGEENIDALLEAAIANGQLLIALSIDGVDDRQNDSCVDVRMGAGIGTTILDTNGAYEPYQTFAFDHSRAEVGLLPRGKIVDGVLTAGPGKVTLPVAILDASFDLALSDAHVHFDVTPDEIGGGVQLDGFASGGINLEELERIVQDLTVSDEVKGAILPVAGNSTDLGLDADGVCTGISAALKLRTTQAFIVD